MDAPAAIEQFRRKPTQPYTLVFSSAINLPKSPFSTTSTVPHIEFGNLCVCCDRPGETHHALRGDGAGDYYGGHVYQAPVCWSCYGHAVSSAFGTRVSALFGGIGVFLAVVGVFANWKVVAVGIGLMALAGGYFWARRQLDLARAKKCHYSLDFHIGEDFVTVYTYNPRLALELLVRHPGMIQPLPD